MEQLFKEAIEIVKGYKLPFDAVDSKLIKIDQELLEESSLSNKQKIAYECQIFFFEKKKQILFYQKITEKSSGFFMKSSTESYSQNGLTLNRKVSGTIIGLNGEKVSYSFNLGEIQKKIKDLGKTAGWKFKLLLSSKKISKLI